MLKQAVLAATGAAHRVRRRKKPGSAGLTPGQVQTVIRRNREFQRLDGVLVALAEACLNPAGGDEVQAVGICSAASAEGKTTVALGLATALARRGDRRVLLIESDLANPTLANDLQRPPIPGLSECLRGQTAPETAIQRTPVEHLSIMTAGESNGDPISLLSRGGLRQLMLSLRSRYSYMLLDMPAILEREEAGRLVELVDGVILVIGAGKVPKDVTESGIAAIGKDKLMGVVLNRARPAAPGWLSRILSTDGVSPAP